MRDPLVDELTAVILAHQRSPLWVVSLFRDDFADVAPRLELANERYVVLFLAPTAANAGTALVVATTAPPGLRDCISLRVMLPDQAAAVWAAALEAEPAAEVGMSKRWQALLAELRTNRARAAVADSAR